jgi:predicted RNA-binding protein
MCEFTVFVVDDKKTEREMVAKNVIAAKIKSGRVLLLDIMGDTKSVDNAFIEDVSTIKQELIVRKNPDL